MVLMGTEMVSDVKVRWLTFLKRFHGWANQDISLDDFIGVAFELSPGINGISSCES
jgi:hypothetical protein